MCRALNLGWCSGFSPIPDLNAGGLYLCFKLLKMENRKQFAMKRVMVKNEADLKLTKQEIARSDGEVRGGRGEERGEDRREGKDTVM